MNERFSAFCDSLVTAFRANPVEIAICVIYAVVGMWNWDSLGSENTILLPLALLLSLAVHNIARGRTCWAYYATIVPPVIMLCVDIQDFINTPECLFLYPLMAVAYLLSRRAADNKAFAADVVAFAHNLAIGVVMGLISMMALSLMVWMMKVLFGLPYGYAFPTCFSWLLVAPVMFVVMQSEERNGLPGFSTFLHIAINFIVCPAILVYTAIFYFYGITIALKWELPDGGLAALVLIYFIATIGGKMLLEVQQRHWYDWFFNRLHLVSVPLMALYWVGLCYRISEYSLTQSRMYLVVAGVVMMIIIVMMFVKRWNSYRWMLIIASIFIVLSTYVPGITAGDFGRRAQVDRFLAMARQMQVLRDGKLDENALMSINESTEYYELRSIYIYLRRDMGRDAEEALLGKWIHDDQIAIVDYKYYTPERRIRQPKDASLAKPALDIHLRRYVLPVEEYRQVLSDEYLYVDKSGAVTVYDDSRTLLLSDTLGLDRLRQMQADGQQIQWQDLTVRNDSVLVVFTTIHGFSDYTGTATSAVVLTK